MLTVSSLTYTAKAMSFNNALKTSTFRGTDYINKNFTVENIHGNSITKVQCIKSFELSQVFLGCYSCLLEVSQQRLCGMLLFHILEAQLYSSITIFFYCLYLSNNTGPASITVHGTFLPSALKTDVIPIFFPNNPGISLNF